MKERNTDFNKEKQYSKAHEKLVFVRKIERKKEKTVDDKKMNMFVYSVVVYFCCWKIQC